MKITTVDIIRSIVFGQSATIAVFALTNMVLNLYLFRPRPARFAGIVLATLSYVGALACVAVVSLSRTGQPATILIWSACVIVASGTLGVSLLLAHVVIHKVVNSDRFFKKWFGDHPDAKCAPPEKKKN